MKKITLITVLLLAGVNLFAELSVKTQAIKEHVPGAYESIKVFSIDKWDTDHNMVVYEINKQCEAFFVVITTVKESEQIQILHRAVLKWIKGEMPDLNENPNALFEIVIDWNMVLYEYEKQTKASESY